MDNIISIPEPFFIKNNYDIAVIGGGPGGIIAAISARTINPKSKICILEKNNSLGKKLLLTGNGRCNYTSSLDLGLIISSFGKKGRFFTEAFNSFSNKDLIEFFKSKDILPQYENNYKVFPKTGNSHTILNCLISELIKADIDIFYNFEATDVSEILRDSVINSTDGKESRCNRIKFFKIDSNLKNTVLSEKIIISTGGASYPQTGATGKGYALAKKLGHSVLELSPSLVAIVSDYLSSLNLKGITIKNVEFSIKSGNKIESKKNGDMIFTHFGISGPNALSFGNSVYKLIKNRKKVIGIIDFYPDIAIEKILTKYEVVQHANSKKEILSVMKIILQSIPGELVLKLFKISGIDPHQKTGNIKKTEIIQFLGIVKKFTFEIDGTLPLSSAIVTEGGIPVKEINPKTMQSKITENLYFAGEIIEMQGPEGGFNLQKAFSTGWLAGKTAAMDVNNL